MKGEVVPGRKGVKWRGLTRCGGHQDTPSGRAVPESSAGATNGALVPSTPLLVWTGGRGGGVGVGEGGGRG